MNAVGVHVRAVVEDDRNTEPAEAGDFESERSGGGALVSKLYHLHAVGDGGTRATQGRDVGIHKNVKAHVFQEPPPPRPGCQAFLHLVAGIPHPMGGTEVSLNVAGDDEMLELLRAANFTTIFIGIESPRVESLLETGKNQNLRGDLIEQVRKIHAYGIQIQAGMIVGFDHDDASIFEEQLRFIQEARIPVSMTGMLQALPKTPLHARIEREGRLLQESGGDQFVLSNIAPIKMSRREFYAGYQWLVSALYDFHNYKKRTLDFLLHRGDQVHRGKNIRKGDLRRLGVVLYNTVILGGPRRAWFTLTLIGTTLLRRPSVIKEAVSFAVVHQAFHRYAKLLGSDLERAVEKLDTPRG